MNKCTIMLLLLSITCYGALTATGDKKIVQGTIQFPHDVTQVPAIRIYYAGNKISCETDHDGKHVTFMLPVQQYQEYFFVLITKSIQFETEENTVKYLKIDHDQAYKLYSLELINHENSPEWKIKEQCIPQDTCRIPDETIIVCFNPDYIETLRGGNAVSLPTLHVCSDLLTQVGSEDNLHELSCELLLACLDYDAIHTAFTSEVKQDNPCKTLVLLNS